MATQFTKNQVVRVKSVIPQGAVQALRMDEDGVVYCLLTWTDFYGTSQTRWFVESELEVV